MDEGNKNLLDLEMASYAGKLALWTGLGGFVNMAARSGAKLKVGAGELKTNKKKKLDE